MVDAVRDAVDVTFVRRDGEHDFSDLVWLYWRPGRFLPPTSRQHYNVSTFRQPYRRSTIHYLYLCGSIPVYAQNRGKHRRRYSRGTTLARLTNNDRLFLDLVPNEST